MLHLNPTLLAQEQNTGSSILSPQFTASCRSQNSVRGVVPAESLLLCIIVFVILLLTVVFELFFLSFALFSHVVKI